MADQEMSKKELVFNDLLLRMALSCSVERIEEGDLNRVTLRNRAYYLALHILEDVLKQEEFPDISFISTSPEGDTLYAKINDVFSDTHIKRYDVRDQSLGSVPFLPDTPVAIVDKNVPSKNELVERLRGTNSYWKIPRCIVEIENRASKKRIADLRREILKNVRVSVYPISRFECKKWQYPGLMMNWDFGLKNGILVVSGMTGSGKTTFVKEYHKRYQNSFLPVKYTSRKPRKGEINGVDYVFSNERIIKRMGEKGELIVYPYSGTYYGIPTADFKFLDEGKDMVIVLNLNGLDALMRYSTSIKNKYPIYSIALWRETSKIRDSLLRRDGSFERADKIDEEDAWYSNNLSMFIWNFYSLYYIPGVEVTHKPTKGFRIRFSDYPSED